MLEILYYALTFVAGIIVATGYFTIKTRKPKHVHEWTAWESAQAEYGNRRGTMTWTREVQIRDCETCGIRDIRKLGQ